MYEEEILKELKEMNKRLEKIESLLYWDDKFGGTTFRNCIARIMRGVE